jgi:hypothetical protein
MIFLLEKGIHSGGKIYIEIFPYKIEKFFHFLHFKKQKIANKPFISMPGDILTNL